MEKDINTPEQIDKTQPNGNENGKPIGFLRYLLILACSVAFVPAIFIPWNKTEWIDDWHYYEYSSGFFLRSLKVILIAVSVITWIMLLYIKYRQTIGNNGQND